MNTAALGPSADAELARFLRAKWPRLAARAYAAMAAAEDDANQAMEAAVADAKRAQVRAVAEAESRAELYEKQSEEAHMLRIKVSELSAQVESLQRREEDLHDEIR